MPDKPSTPEAAGRHADSTGGDDEQRSSAGLPMTTGSDGAGQSDSGQPPDETGSNDEQGRAEEPQDSGGGKPFPEERPAQFARPPYFDADSPPHTVASFVEQQLGANFHDFEDEAVDVDGGFARETDSQMYFVSPDPPEPDPLSPDLTLLLPPRKATAWAAVIVAIVGFTWFGKTLSNVLAPMALAVFLGYLIVPMVSLFSRIRVPRALGYMLSSLVIAGGFFGVGAIISASVAEFRSNFPHYEQNLDVLMTRLTSFARNVGLIGSGDSLNIKDVFESLPVGGMQEIVSGGAAYMFEFASYFAVTAIFLMFMIWEAERFSDRVRGAYSHGAAERILAVVHKLNGDIQRYVLLKAVVSAITATLAYIVMVVFGLDFAGVLMLIIFLANFIPYIGSVVGTLLPGIVALLQYPSWSEGLIVVVLITVIQQVLGNIVEPRLQGRSLNVSPLIILISLAYFGWMWGIVGMIVSVPIAAGFRLIFEQFDLTKPLARMMRNI